MYSSERVIGCLEVVEGRRLEFVDTSDFDYNTLLLEINEIGK
jgi:hypothetical protein